MVDKLEKAIENFAPKTVVVAGGVAANSALREEMKNRLSGKVAGELIFTPMEFCTDNAAMVATLGVFHALLGEAKNPLEMEVRPSLSMENAKWIEK